MLTRIYEGSGASVFVVALWHTCLNLGLATEAGGGAAQIAVTAFVIAWAMVIARTWERRDPASRAVATRS